MSEAPPSERGRLVSASIDILDDEHANKALEPHFIAIGQVAAYWAQLEFEINAMIWSLASIDQQTGMCLTSQFTTIQSRARALLSIFRLRGGSETVAKEVNRFFVNEVDPVAQQRNRIVHDPLYVALSDGKVMRASVMANKTLDARMRFNPLEDAQKTLLSIRAILSKFNELHDAMMASLPTSDKK